MNLVYTCLPANTVKLMRHISADAFGTLTYYIMILIFLQVLWIVKLLFNEC